jgi:hypothetical protein
MMQGVCRVYELGKDARIPCSSIQTVNNPELVKKSFIINANVESEWLYEIMTWCFRFFSLKNAGARLKKAALEAARDAGFIRLEADVFSGDALCNWQ